MNLSDFDYPLPKELIAQRPLERRDASRLLVADRKSSSLADKRFSDLVDLIPPGDTLVLNDTKVFPARILGKKKGTGGKVDILLLNPTEDPRVWRCLIQPSPKEGHEYTLGLGSETLDARFEKRGADTVALVRFEGDDVRGFAERNGTMPLPPYIKREPADEDRGAYQTVFARKEGAVAAPTAGLHFTPELLDALRKKGVGIRTVTLHVGYGTFKPVDDLESHRMHSEAFELTDETAAALNETRAAKKKIWAVGTTTLRVLETCVKKGVLIPGRGETDLYVREPFPFEAVDRLVTNFHLPKTTLLLLVSAFMGEAFRKKAYEHAIREKYRFYSYGDAMVIV
ncbi:MAG TPA: tRNA preQ1(34) S-adenosylmethionine ribosyltransferase-isomerase QueA [Candidatus Eisenbacteria bacterium]|nr:tRNA preQ1(34) S-adenosylmethionine ribosyltransferase-isomerase QueA [Candidatus Eisenbacteria bacterium]